MIEDLARAIRRIRDWRSLNNTQLRNRLTQTRTGDDGSTYQLWDGSTSTADLSAAKTFIDTYEAEQDRQDGITRIREEVTDACEFGIENGYSVAEVRTYIRNRI